MIDELLDEPLFRSIPPSRQEELISRYCRGVLETIKGAADREEAKRIVEEACAGFERECASPLIRRALVDHVRRFYAEHRQP